MKTQGGGALALNKEFEVTSQLLVCNMYTFARLISKGKCQGNANANQRDITNKQNSEEKKREYKLKLNAEQSAFICICSIPPSHRGVQYIHIKDQLPWGWLYFICAMFDCCSNDIYYRAITISIASSNVSLIMSQLYLFTYYLYLRCSCSCAFDREKLMNFFFIWVFGNILHVGCA